MAQRALVTVYDRSMRLAGLCALLVVAVTSTFGGVALTWGNVAGNLQLGIGATTESSPSGTVILVSLRNVGAEMQRVTIGFDGSAGPVYNVEFTAARAQQAGEQLIFDLNALKARPGGVLIPKVVGLEPGSSQMFTFPIGQLICIVDRREVALETLLQRGYSIRASFRTSGIRLVTPSWVPPK